MENLFKNLNLDQSEKDYQWFKFKDIYSKLRYLNELIDNFYIKDTDLFLINLDNFLKLNEYIISSQIDTFKINYFKTTDCIDNIKTLLKIYDLILPIMEERMDKYFVDKIEDKIFLEKFKGIKM